MKPLRPTDDLWRRVKTITADALELPEGEHQSFLATACAGDPTLLAEVESLLGAHGRAGSFLEASGLAAAGAARAVARAAEQAVLPTAAGRRIGPYRVLGELGRGGMGVVYLAERADAAFEKKVAIKVVRGGFAAGALMHRFQEERRILATLDHPNIARLLDAGTTEDGLPYFVMEHVDGIPLDVYAQAPLALGQRLALFHEVCAAVQYAHQRLVIHRDIKARNILVTPDGTPKLLDFGIAKLLEPGLEGEEQTRTGLRALTLEGASPEQVRGEPLTVTSDVYALGVLLYRLLTGQSPYGPGRRSDPDLMRAICEEAPARPSTVAPSEQRRPLGGELDWITLKALRKEADRRYPSVEQLADDIQRYQGGRPVTAAPDSWRYRARKFAARNRTRVAAGALLALSLVAGVTATIWQARRAEEQRARAERRFNDVRKLATSVMGEIHDAIEAVPGTTAARGLLLQRACEHLDALALDAPDDPALAEEVATSYHRLGSVLSASGAASLGDPAAARAIHRKGLALRKALAERSPDDLDARSRLVESLVVTAYAEDEVGPSLGNAQAAVAAAESLVADRPQDLQFRRQLATAHYALGTQHRLIGDNDRALASFQKATPLFQAVYDAGPGSRQANRDLAFCHKVLGAILVERRSPLALDHLRQAVVLDEARLAETPAAPQERRDASVSSIQLGYGLLETGDVRGALVAYRRALALREGLMRDDPTNAIGPRDVASALWYIGTAESSLGDWSGALASFGRAIPLANPNSGRDDLRARLASGMADAYEGSGRLADALRLRKEALEHHRALFARQPQIRTLRRGVVEDQRALGLTLTRMSRWREAREAYEDGLKVAAGLDSTPPDPGDVSLLDDLRQGLDRCDAALATADGA
jgi:non-specific serine/threonine protein kinase/serine/threonine-protein kinase